MIMSPPSLKDDARLNYALSSWQRWRGTKPWPSRADIDPADFRALLPNLYMIEREADGRLRFILSGTTVRSQLGFELSGRYLDDLFQDAHLERARAAYERVLRGQGDYMLQHWSRHGRPLMQFRRLLLPLSKEPAGGIDLILGVALYDAMEGHDGEPIDHIKDPVDIAVIAEQAIPLDDTMQDVTP